MKTATSAMLVLVLLGIANAAAASTATRASGLDAKLPYDRLTDQGEVRELSSRRTLLQTGSATNFQIPKSPTATQSATKLNPTGNECYIASSRSTSLDCGVIGVGTVLQQVPSCCSSTSLSTSNVCSSYDSATGISCTNSARPYAACCTLRNQPAAACTVARTSVTDLSCPQDKPAPACCDNPTDPDCDIKQSAIVANSAARSCKSSQNLACCPA